jgi:pyridoxal 5'-phosphate synthase pdxS subunit
MAGDATISTRMAESRWGVARGEHKHHPRRISIVAERNGSRNGNGASSGTKGSFKVKSGLAQMLKGGVIMDVVTPEHARIAQDAGAAAVMALERVPADIRKQGGVARMSDPDLIKSIMEAVTIPVMAKCRIGHFVEAQILEALGVDYIDESEVLTPADEENHIDKHPFKVPFVCGCRDLGEATRRIFEGAAMIRTKGEAGTGNVVEAVRHARAVNAGIRKLRGMDRAELAREAKLIGAPLEVLAECKRLGRLPVVNFAAGGIATPADAALMMQLGVDGVFVGSGIFKSEDPLKRAKAIVAATTYFDRPELLAEVSAGLGKAMEGLEISTIPKGELLAARGR